MRYEILSVWEEGEDCFKKYKKELNELREKRQRLDNFMPMNVFADLSNEERRAVLRQCEGMTEYMAALHKRIELIRGWMK